MQRHHKSRRHQLAAHTRWLRAEQRAQSEREAGTEDRRAPIDVRDPLLIDLRSYGGRLLRIEPRHGYIACRLLDANTGELIECAALKTLLHRIADSMPRTLGMRHVW